MFLRINEDEEIEEDSKSEVSSQTSMKNKVVEDVKPSTPNSIELQYDEKEYGLWVGSQPTDLVRGYVRILQQFVALLYKRYVHSIRNIVLTLTQIFIPIGLMIIQLLYLKYAPLKPTDMPPREINIGQYKTNYAPYKVNIYNDLSADLMNKLANAYQTRFDWYSNAEAFNLDDKVV